MKLFEKRRNISIISMLILTFILLLFVTMAGIGYYVFSNWYDSTKEITISIEKDINQKVTEQIDTFFQKSIDTENMAYKMIKNNAVDLSDEQKRDRFFVSALQSCDKDIYSISYGTVDGVYYGALRNQNGKIEIIKNNAETNGESWNYMVNEDGTVGELSKNEGKFDPRNEKWYQDAAAAGDCTFSSVDRQSTVNDLVIFYSCPIYGSQGELRGVLEIHILLANIGDYLKNIISSYNGYTAIIEADTRDMIVNSINKEQSKIGSRDISVLQTACLEYFTHHKANFCVTDNNKDWLINVQEYKKPGFDWQIISAVPERLLMGEIHLNICLTVIFVVLGTVLSLAVYVLCTRKLFKPMKELLTAAEEFSAGDLSRRIEISRNDEIGRISNAFNHLANRIKELVNHLKDTVAQRTEELNQANELSREHQDQLRLILDTTAEGIFGTDLDGKCTFCNKSCLELLRYSDQEDLLGKNMHLLIHHTHRDGSSYSEAECPIAKSIRRGEDIYSSNDIFWRSNGCSFDVEYRVMPQFRDRQNIGSVITFIDITERKKDEEKIYFLSRHDSLTGLLNRNFFEQKMEEQDTEDNLPISIIFIDINGLKMVNDVFGHASGDELIQKVAVVLKRNCREKDTVARVGGDEFTIFLPRTTQREAVLIAQKLRTECSWEKVNMIVCSIAAGIATKFDHYQKMEKILESSENEMYKEKAVSSKNFSVDAINSIIQELHKKNPWHKQHSEAVRNLCEKLGMALALSETEIKKLCDAGYLHDIGKITLSKDILDKKTNELTESEKELLRQHAAAGYRILNLSQETLDLASGVYGHHECWDGSGYPKGLKGKEIPLISRIIAVAEAYESALHQKGGSEENALKIITEGAGKCFDPQIAEVLLQIKRRNPFK